MDSGWELRNAGLHESLRLGGIGFHYADEQSLHLDLHILCWIRESGSHKAMYISWWSGDGVDVCRLYVDDSYPSSANPNLTALRSSIRRPFVPKTSYHLNLNFRLQKRALERVG